MSGPTYTCKVCGQDFWHEATEMLRILPDHLDSPECRRARLHARARTVVGGAFARFWRWLTGRPVERLEYVITVPMEPVDTGMPGPIDLLAPAFEAVADARGDPPQPLRWRRSELERLRTAVDAQLALARRQGLRPVRPVDYLELRRRGRCRAVYPERFGGDRRAQGREEITILMTRR